MKPPLEKRGHDWAIPFICCIFTCILFAPEISVASDHYGECGHSVPAQSTPELPAILNESGLVKNLNISTLSGSWKKELRRDKKTKEFGVTSFLSWKNLLEYLKTLSVYNSVKVIQVRQYPSTDAWGRPRTLSGVVIVPLTSDKTASMPMLAFQHPTQVERRYSPSNCVKYSEQDPQYNVTVATLIAAMGYVVVVPDYPGMGLNFDSHPYVHKSLANGVLDLVKYANDKLNADPHHYEKWNFGSLYWPVWDNNIYLMGYSEGGYATLAAARALQEAQAPGSPTIKAVAGLDGPYSLSTVMSEVILAKNPNFTAPYFLPYVVNGYDGVYFSNSPPVPVSEFNWFRNIQPSSPAHQGNFASELRRRLDGSFDGAAINAMMREINPYEGPLSSLTADFLADLGNPDSNVHKVLASNDIYNGWTPSMPLMMFHHILDDLVPYGNAQVALKSFIEGGAQYTGLMPYAFHLGDASKSGFHPTAAPIAYLLAIEWMNLLSDLDQTPPATAKAPAIARQTGKTVQCGAALRKYGLLDQADGAFDLDRLCRSGNAQPL